MNTISDFSIGKAGENLVVDFEESLGFFEYVLVQNKVFFFEAEILFDLLFYAVHNLISENMVFDLLLFDDFQHELLPFLTVSIELLDVFFAKRLDIGFGFEQLEEKLFLGLAYLRIEYFHEQILLEKRVVLDTQNQSAGPELPLSGGPPEGLLFDPQVGSQKREHHVQAAPGRYLRRDPNIGPASSQVRGDNYTV